MHRKYGNVKMVHKHACRSLGIACFLQAVADPPAMHAAPCCDLRFRLQSRCKAMQADTGRLHVCVTATADDATSRSDSSLKVKCLELKLQTRIQTQTPSALAPSTTHSLQPCKPILVLLPTERHMSEAESEYVTTVDGQDVSTPHAHKLCIRSTGQPS